jgi:hypothetical protein
MHVSAELHRLDLLDLSGLLPINGAPRPSQKVVCQMFEGWDVVKENFDVIWSKVAIPKMNNKQKEIWLESEPNFKRLYTTSMTLAQNQDC